MQAIAAAVASALGKDVDKGNITTTAGFVRPVVPPLTLGVLGDKAPQAQAQARLPPPKAALSSPRSPRVEMSLTTPRTTAVGHVARPSSTSWATRAAEIATAESLAHQATFNLGCRPSISTGGSLCVPRGMQVAGGAACTSPRPSQRVASPPPGGMLSSVAPPPQHALGSPRGQQPTLAASRARLSQRQLNQAVASGGGKALGVGAGMPAALSTMSPRCSSPAPPPPCRPATAWGGSSPGFPLQGNLFTGRVNSPGPSFNAAPPPSLAPLFAARPSSPPPSHFSPPALVGGSSSIPVGNYMSLHGSASPMAIRARSPSPGAMPWGPALMNSPVNFPRRV